LPMPGRGEAPRPLAQEVEVATAIAEPERPAQTANLMEAICPGSTGRRNAVSTDGKI